MRARRRSSASGTSPNAVVTPAHTRGAALRLLMRRDYTVAELTAALTARDHPPDIVAGVVADLAADGTVDDRRTAAAHVRTATRVKNRGVRRIRRELEARGLAADVVRDALAAIEPADEAAALTKLIARSRLPRRPTPAERQRLFRQLLRRGFAPDRVARALGVRPPDDD